MSLARQKPLPGALLNHGHSLSRGLVFAASLLEGTGQVSWDAVARRVLTGVGAPTWTYPAGNAAIHLVAASTQYFDAGDLRALASIPQTTWIARMRRTVSGSAVQVGKGTSGDSTAIQVWSDGNIYCALESGSIGGYGFVAAAGTEWITVALRFDGSQATNATRLRIWVDGQERAASYVGTIAAATTASTASLLVGNGARSAPATSDGDIEYFYAWDRALDPQEIAAISADPYAIFHSSEFDPTIVGVATSLFLTGSTSALTLTTNSGALSTSDNLAGSTLALSLVSNSGTLTSALELVGSTLALTLASNSGALTTPDALVGSTLVLTLASNTGALTTPAVGAPTATLSLETIPNGAVRVELLDVWGATASPTDPGNPIAAVNTTVDAVSNTVAITPLAGGSKRFTVPFVFRFEHTYTIVVDVVTADANHTLFVRTFTVRTTDAGDERVELRVMGPGTYSERVEMFVRSGAVSFPERVELTVLSGGVVTVEEVDVTVIPGLAVGYFTAERVELIVATLVIVDVAFSVSMDVGDVAYALFAASEEIEGEVFAGFSASEDVTAEVFAPGLPASIEQGAFAESLFSASLDVGTEEHGAFPASVEGRGELLAGIEVRVELRNEDLAEVEDT